MRFRTAAFEKIKITLKYNVNLNFKICTTVSVRQVIYPNTVFPSCGVRFRTEAEPMNTEYYTILTILFFIHC